jgi:hypothetical protein
MGQTGVPETLVINPKIDAWLQPKKLLSNITTTVEAFNYI